MNEPQMGRGNLYSRPLHGNKLCLLALQILSVPHCTPRATSYIHASTDVEQRLPENSRESQGFAGLGSPSVSVCQISSTSLSCFKLNCEHSYLLTALSSLSWKKRGSTKRRNGTVMIRTKGKARDATVDFTTQSSTMQAS